ncbi:cytochrome P450 [Poronia punctata]|nr:cytochrome P450 [Poronia punctata]
MDTFSQSQSQSQSQSESTTKNNNNPSSSIPPFLLLAGTVIIGFLFAYYILSHLTRRKGRNDHQLPVYNRLFPFEPSFFARLRWSTGALGILDDADKKSAGKPYKLSRGDKTLTVLPTTLLPEINRLGSDVLDARRSHSHAFVSHLTGLERTVDANYQSRILQRRVSPGLQDLYGDLTECISRSSILGEVDQNEDEDEKGEGKEEKGEWKEVNLLGKVVAPCFAASMSLVLFGVEMVKMNKGEGKKKGERRVVECVSELTEALFAVALTMRLIPTKFLQRILVWFLPAKWTLNNRWRELEKDFITPEVRRQQQQQQQQSTTTTKEKGSSSSSDLLSWMIRDATTPFESDPSILTTLCGSVATASIFSTANLICHLISDLTSHPEVLSEVVAEIRDRHKELNGRWDVAAFTSGGLDKLESAMKETARIASSPLIVCSRVVKKDVVLGGLPLKRGEFITVSGRQRTMDPELFNEPHLYKGLRFCAPDQIDKHRARSFSSVDLDLLTWGAGRAACPGRVIADVAAKIFLVQLLDRYEFAFLDGKKGLEPGMLHEFVFFNPDNKMLIRPRKDAVGIRL